MDGKQMNKPLSFFFTVLVGIMICVSLLANVLSTLVAPYQLGVFMLSGGFIVFPITYVVSDCLQEVYGYNRSRKVSWLVAGVNLFASLFYIFMYNFLGAERGAGIEQLAKVSMHITIAGILALQLGSFMNDVTFQLIRNVHKARYLWIRSVISSSVAQLFDSSFFVIVGLKLAFNLPWHIAGWMVFSQFTAKMIVEVVLIPARYGARRIGRRFDPDARTDPKKFTVFGTAGDK